MQKEIKNKSNLIARECLETALLQLISEKPLSTINISELCKKAGVSRMTFYRNYDSKEDILLSQLQSIFAAYWNEDTDVCTKGIYYDSRHMRHCFEYFYRYRDFLDGLICCGFGNLFLSSLTAHLIKRWAPDPTDKKTCLRLTAFAGSIYSLYIDWSSNGYKNSLEELSAIMGNIYKANN